MKLSNVPKESATMSFQDIYARLHALSLKVNTINTQFVAFFTAGLLFWGVTQTLIFRRLDQIDATAADVNSMKSEINLIQYRQDAQDGFNDAVADELKEQKAEVDDKFKQLLGTLKAPPTSTSRPSSPHN